MAPPLTIVVTGSNRGIGQEIIHLLANTQHPRPLTIYATSRSGANLNIEATSANQVRYANLDISSKSSIEAFLAATLKEAGNIDVLINNAGINYNDAETPDLAEQTINVNYYGTKDMCELFLNQGKMKNTPGSRIVNVSSGASALASYPSDIQERFRSAKSMSDVDTLAQEYIAAIKSNEQGAAVFGAPPRSYQVSKAVVNALTRVLARENESVAINCCCPGWVSTDMGNRFGKAPKTLEEGARIPVRLAIGELGSAGDADGRLSQGTEHVSGKFYANDGGTEVGWGKIQEW